MSCTLSETTFNSKSMQKKVSMRYLSAEEQRELYDDCGDAGIVLAIFLLGRSGRKNYVFKDENIAKALGWSKEKAQRIRLALVRAGWFWQRKRTFRDGLMLISYYFGKDIVAKAKENNMKLKHKHKKEKMVETELYLLPANVVIEDNLNE